MIKGDRPRIVIPATPPRSDPDAVMTAVKVIIKPPDPAVQIVYQSPDATLTELADNSWVWEAPAPLTVVGKYLWYVRGTGGIEAADQGEFVIHGTGVTYA